MAQSRSDHEQICVQHVSRLCIIKQYSSRVYAADFTLRFDKKPTSPGEPHKWQRCGCCRCMAAKTTSWVCAVLSYDVETCYTCYTCSLSVELLACTISKALSVCLWVQTSACTYIWSYLLHGLADGTRLLGLAVYVRAKSLSVPGSVTWHLTACNQCNGSNAYVHLFDPNTPHCLRASKSKRPRANKRSAGKEVGTVLHSPSLLPGELSLNFAHLFIFVFQLEGNRPSGIYSPEQLPVWYCLSSQHINSHRKLQNNNSSRSDDIHSWLLIGALEQNRIDVVILC